jgi:HlyD family secretion protein
VARKKSLTIAVLIFVVAGVAAGWLFWSQRSDPGQKISGRPEMVTRSTVHRLVVSTGTIKAQVGAQVKVGARVSGRVEKLLVSIGQEVSAGQVVAIIEHKDLKARLEQALAELDAAKARLQRVQATGPKEVARAQAEVREDQAIGELAAINLKRQKDMRQSDLVAEQAFDQARERNLVALAQLAASQARLAQVRASFEQDRKVSRAEVASAQAKTVTAGVNLDYATLRAPIGGVVSTVSTQEGETVAASLNSPTFITIVDLSRLQVDNFVDETDIGLVKMGQNATFVVDAYLNKIFKGKVKAIHPSAQIVDDVVYYDVVIEILGNYRHLLKPEMTATVSIVTGQRENVLTVPAEAVRRKGGRGLVYLQENGKVEALPVQLGWSEGGRVEVKSGLKEGQVVIVPQARTMGGRGGGR